MRSIFSSLLTDWHKTKRTGNSGPFCLSFFTKTNLNFNPRSGFRPPATTSGLPPVCLYPVYTTFSPASIPKNTKSRKIRLFCALASKNDPNFNPRVGFRLPSRSSANARRSVSTITAFSRHVNNFPCIFLRFSSKNFPSRGIIRAERGPTSCPHMDSTQAYSCRNMDIIRRRHTRRFFSRRRCRRCHRCSRKCSHSCSSRSPCRRSSNR